MLTATHNMMGSFSVNLLRNRGDGYYGLILKVLSMPILHFWNEVSVLPLFQDIKIASNQ